MTPIQRRLKQAREKAGIPQDKLGRMAGIDEFSASARMSQYESGKRTPNYQILEKIGECLGYPVEFFYTKDDVIAEIIYLLHNASVYKKVEMLKSIKYIDGL